MATYLGIDMAQEMADALGDLVYDATLIKVTQGARASIAVAPTETTASYACKGHWQSLSSYLLSIRAAVTEESQVVGTDVAITLLGASIASSKVPAINDRVTIDGTTYDIVEILDIPPSKAVYVLRGRPHG